MLENPPGGGEGPHIHILMHIPPEGHEALTAELAGRITAAMGLDREELVRLREVRKHLRAVGKFKEAKKVRLPFHFRRSRSNPGYLLSERERLVRLRYMAKGADPDIVAPELGRRETLLQHARKNHCGEDVLPDKPHITLRKPGNVRARGRAGSSHFVGKKARREAGWVEDKSLAWLSREGESEKLLVGALALLKAAWSSNKPKPIEVSELDDAIEISKSDLPSRLLGDMTWYNMGRKSEDF